MASSKKTENYGLNQWQGTDVPKREDFVNDNAILDRVINTHETDTRKHFTEKDRIYFDEPIHVGYYVGDGVQRRELILPFTPKFFVVFAENKPMNQVDFISKTRDVNFGMAALGEGSWGINIDNNVVTLYQSVMAELDTEFRTFNSKGITYIYVAFR